MPRPADVVAWEKGTEKQSQTSIISWRARQFSTFRVFASQEVAIMGNNYRHWYHEFCCSR